MSLKDIIHKLGFHSWGDWQYVSDSCEQISCEQIRRCSYDGITQQRMKHEWSDAEYKSASSCEQICSCYRCKEIKSLGEHHPSSIGVDRYSEQICGKCGSQLDAFMNC